MVGNTIEDTQICDLTDKYLQFAGYTWSEVEAYRDEESKLLTAQQHEKYEVQVAAQSAIRNIVLRAEARRKENGRPDTSKLQETQTKEQVAEGQTESLKTLAMVGSAPMPPASAPCPRFEESKVTEEWDRVLEERRRRKTHNQSQ